MLYFPFSKIDDIAWLSRYRSPVPEMQSAPDDPCLDRLRFGQSASRPLGSCVTLSVTAALISEIPCFHIDRQRSRRSALAVARRHVGEFPLRKVMRRQRRGDAHVRHNQRVPAARRPMPPLWPCQTFCAYAISVQSVRLPRFSPVAIPTPRPLRLSS